MSSISVMTRRSALLLAAGAAICATTGSRAAEEQIVTVHKDPSCGCCSGWVAHLQQAGFIVKAIETADLDPIKTRLGVPNDLGGLPHSANRRLRHRGPRSRSRAQTVPQRQAERNRACRSWHAGRLSRHGGRERGAVRGRDVWTRRTTHLHAICRRPRTLIGSGASVCIDWVFCKGRSLAALNCKEDVHAKSKSKVSGSSGIGGCLGGGIEASHCANSGRNGDIAVSGGCGPILWRGALPHSRFQNSHAERRYLAAGSQDPRKAPR